MPATFYSHRHTTAELVMRSLTFKLCIARSSQRCDDETLVYEWNAISANAAFMHLDFPTQDSPAFGLEPCSIAKPTHLPHPHHPLLYSLSALSLAEQY